MFWSGNFIGVRELNFLLKEENVTLSQVLEADDILQECKADNKNLMQFLTRPDILAELITLITEEPPQNVELTSQYRLASIACEVLTSDLSHLSDKLSLASAQMTRLCDFLARPPPLNPLLASYFSKTIEMLLERSTKQDWYLYHIVCLRVLDFFKSRRDFLPNLLRHMATSAIADTFKYFIRLDDLFNKIVMEWFEEHQLLESLIQVVCGGYLPDDAHDETGQDKLANHTNHTGNDTDTIAGRSCRARHTLSARLQAVASANAASLLCDVVVCGDTRCRTQETLVARLQSEECVRLLLQSMFTCAARARAFAVVNGCRLLAALLSQEPILSTGCGSAERSPVELGVAPHLPLLHQALLQDPRGGSGGGSGLGAPRLQLAALVAQLALSDLDEICNALRALGTPGVLLELMFSFPDNNFLHGEVYTLVKHALANRTYRTQYANHLLLECDLLTRLMDVFEENEGKKPTGDGEGKPATRAAYMGHVILMLEKIARALDTNDGELASLLPTSLLDRWTAFSHSLAQLLQQRHVPLGGYYPSETIYEVDNMSDNLAAEYDFHDMSATATMADAADEFAGDDINWLHNAVGKFWERASQRCDDDAWDDTPAADADADDDACAAGNALPDTWLPWEQEGGGGAAEAGAGWAQFDALPAPPAPVDPFAPVDNSGAEPSSAAADEEFSASWPPQPASATGDTQPSTAADAQSALERGVGDLQLDCASSVSLATHLLTAIRALPAHQRATIVNADLAHLVDTPDVRAVSDVTGEVPSSAVASTNGDVAADVTDTFNTGSVHVGGSKGLSADSSSSSVNTGSSCAGAGSSSADTDTFHGEAISSSADNGSSSANTGSSSVDTGSSSADTGSSSANTGSSSADTGSSSADTGSSSADTGSSSADTGSSSCDTNGDS